MSIFRYPVLNALRLNVGRDPVFYGMALLLTAACLWPIWQYRFLPMQDYPQHLFIASVLTTYDTPGFDWQQYYRADLHLGPYSLEYWMMRAFASVMSIEAAGKLFISVYVVLIGVLVLRAAQRAPSGQTPWALLLMFPLVFNQVYFLGFTNYLLSLPLLFLALMDLDDFAARAFTWPGAVRHGLYQWVLFLCHPFTVAVYLVLATVSAAYQWPERIKFQRTIWPVVFLSLVFAGWALTQYAAPTVLQDSEWKVRWWPFERVWKFFVMMFTGMRIHDGIDSLVAGLWIAVFMLMLGSALRTRAHLWPVSRYAAWFCLALLGYLILPYWFGYYAFFNLRLAPVAMMVFALLCAQLKLARSAGYAVAGLCVALVALSAQIHAKVARESEEILPLLQKMERNARVLPLYLNARTEVIDAEFFYQLHAHDHNYYHVLVGGGASPFLFPNPMLPVQYQAQVQLPAPIMDAPVVNFDWPTLHARYRYILVRGDEPQLLLRYLVQNTKALAHSGPWMLFENIESMRPPSSD